MIFDHPHNDHPHNDAEYVLLASLQVRQARSHRSSSSGDAAQPVSRAGGKVSWNWMSLVTVQLGAAELTQRQAACVVLRVGLPAQGSRIMNLFGKITSGLAVAALAGCAVQGSAEASARAAAGGIWTARTVLTLTSPELLAAVDPAADAAYEMAGGEAGPFRLERVDLATGAVRRGPALPVAGLLPAAGYVWIYGRQAYPRGQAKLVLYQVSPSTLARVRSWLVARGSAAGLTVTAGPGRSVWVGYQGRLLRLDATSGATAATIKLPAGRDVVSASAGPAGRYLYVSAWSGSTGWVSEYAASTGHLLAATALSSAGPSALTAVPGGAWASFRTGMNGRTVLLRQRGLREVTPSASIFIWPMDATTVYGGGRLWLAGEPGAAGCIAPGTGQVADQGRVPLLESTPWLLVVNAIRQLLYAQHGPAIISITPPRACWS